MTTSPITAYTVVLQHHDRSALLGAFGPYSTKEAAETGITALKQMPLADGLFEVVPMFGTPGGTTQKQPVYRDGGQTR